MKIEFRKLDYDVRFRCPDWHAIGELLSDDRVSACESRQALADQAYSAAATGTGRQTTLKVPSRLVRVLLLELLAGGRNDRVYWTLPFALIGQIRAQNRQTGS